MSAPENTGLSDLVKRRMKITEKVPHVLDRVADKVLAHRAPARTTKAKKRQRARRKAQRESSN
jgi:hypothetical protein